LESAKLVVALSAYTGYRPAGGLSLTPTGFPKVMTQPLFGFLIPPVSDLAVGAPISGSTTARTVLSLHSGSFARHAADAGGGSTVFPLF
jgi:hypothetical protein